jgi:peptidoglycan/LPS O-acetylase OafA/YrhL
LLTPIIFYKTLMKSSVGFRYDIAALRAVAVIAVLLYHFNIPFFDGGFSGVDIFFVISGYLMTKIILNGIDGHEFSLLQFYKKRADRIIPALVFMVLSTSLICFFLYMPDDYREVTRNASASVLFCSNMSYALIGSYFGNSADNNIYLHTWSLSLEWQFYLLLPIVLIVAKKYLKIDRKRYFHIFLITILINFGGSLLVTRYFPNHAFYQLPPRSWELLFGGLAFLTPFHLRPGIRRLMACAGFAILILGVIFLNSGLKWPGFYTLFPVVSTYLILIANFNDFKLLKLEAVQFFGRISYSLYLWHWPIFVLGNYLGISFSPVNAFLGISLSILLGYLSYRYIEPFHLKKGTHILAIVASLGLVVGIASTTNVNQFIFKQETLKISDYEAHDGLQRNLNFGQGCFITKNMNGLGSINIAGCLPIYKGKRNILLLGDSHAAQFFPALKSHFADKGINLGHASASSCLPLKTAGGPGPGNCDDLLTYIFGEFLPQNAADIESIILSANWVDNPHGKEQLLADIKNTIKHLDKLGIKTVVLGQTETYKIDYSTIAAMEHEYGIDISDNYLDKETKEINEYLKAGLKDKYIDLFNLSYLEKVSPEKIPYMFDQNHLTDFGVEQVLKGQVYDDPRFKLK